MTDKTTVNLVVALLGLALIGCIAGAIALTAAHDTVPEQMWTVGSTALGALAAVLVSTRTSMGAPAPVNVVNAPDDPVPVDAGPVDAGPAAHAPSAVDHGTQTVETIDPATIPGYGPPA